MLFKFRSKKDYKEHDILGGLDNYSSSKASAELIFLLIFIVILSKTKNIFLSALQGLVT